MDPSTLGLVAGLTGGALGVLGGVVGTAVGLANTRGHRERVFAVRAAVVLWLAVTAFLLALWLTPMPYGVLLWLPFGVLFPFAIRYGNRQLERLRSADTSAGQELSGAADRISH